MTKHPFRRRGRAAAAVLGLTLAAALAACSAAPKANSTSAAADRRGASAPEAAPPQAPGGATDFGNPTDKSGGSGGGTTGKPATLPQTAVQRSIIYNGSMTVQATDVNGAADRAEALANGAGGYIGGDARQTISGHAEATIVLRVPADHFDATMSALAALGTSTDRQVTTQDVTSQVIDIGSRIKTQQASVDRVRALLSKATSIGDVVSIESELTQRESDLESLEAQLAGLQDLSALSTITLTLIEPNAPKPAVEKKPAAKGFVAGLKAGWKSFRSGTSTLLTWLGAVLPFLLGIGIPVWLIWWLLRRRNRGRFAMAPAGPGPAAPLPPPAAPLPPEKADPGSNG